MNNKRVIATIEARIASQRLPGKILYPLAGVPMIGRIALRLENAKKIDEVVIATTISEEDQVVEDLGRRMGIRVFRGSINDISERLRKAAAEADIIVQITGDCPMIDSNIVDEAVELLLNEKVDYVSNSLNTRTYPIGYDVRAFTMKALMKSMNLSNDPIDRIHGSYFIERRTDLFSHATWCAPMHLRMSGLRLTVDEPADYELAYRIYDRLASKDPFFSLDSVLEILRQNPEWIRINENVKQKSVMEG